MTRTVGQTVQKPGIQRRDFLKGSVAIAASVGLGAPFEALAASGTRLDASPDYGPLGPVDDRNTGLPLLQLPREFSYVSMSWTGDPMRHGGQVPSRHDGGAALRGPGGRVHYVRNHEQSFVPGPPALASSFAPRILSYDGGNAPGGTTTVVFDPDSGGHLHTIPSLSGTVRNCAGGPTPWNSWLSCEETLDGPGDAAFGADLEQTHGWVFEVPAHKRAKPDPIVGLGRFVHEAAAVDPRTGVVYQTEDQRSSGIYRFVPDRPGRLHRGGTLQMLRIAGQPRFDTSDGVATGSVFPVEWVTVSDPANDPFSQGFDAGGAVFKRGEGMWYGSDHIFFTCTSAGAAGEGQVWELDPAGNRLRLIFESPAPEVLDNPDNIALSPRGGIVVCEDGSGPDSFVRGLTRAGEIFDFVKNDVSLEASPNGVVAPGDYRGSEFAGASFTPDGRWLFVSVQTPGITFAITGPWERGTL
jgi:secreted PhoX family phosphatase